MSVNAPKGLFPSEPEHYRGPKLKVGADKNLLVKDHTHTFVNKGGEIGELDFRFPIGAPLHGIRPFLSTNQLKTYDEARNAVALALSPVVKALVSPDGAMKDIRNLDSVSNDIFVLFKGYTLGFIACDKISARCMLTIFSLFATKTEASLLRMLKGSPDVCLSGPIRKYIEDKGGRWGCRQIMYDRSADGETYVTGLAMSKMLHPRSYMNNSEGPDEDPFRPDQKTPLKNFFLAGSYSKQDYIDSMEGATLSGRQASAYICDAGEELVALRKKLAAAESPENTVSCPVTDEPSLV
uniref:Amine oxidase domain-containing protein n=1 Tax=Manihot esculenta TaxID=3983 RepID=A0A2C9VCE5_MANES